MAQPISFLHCILQRIIYKIAHKVYNNTESGTHGIKSQFLSDNANVSLSLTSWLLCEQSAGILKFLTHTTQVHEVRLFLLLSRSTARERYIILRCCKLLYDGQR